MKINRTNIQHGLYALAIQIVIGLITGDWLAGACAGVAFFVGREHAQQEVTLARSKHTRIDNLKPWEGFTGWDRDRALDVLVPTVACAALYLAMETV